jgi:hypothetical protein
VAVALVFPTRRVLLLRGARAFLVPLAFPLLFGLTLMSQFSSFYRKFPSLEISFSLLSV